MGKRAHPRHLIVTAAREWDMTDQRIIHYKAGSKGPVRVDNYYDSRYWTGRYVASTPLQVISINWYRFKRSIKYLIMCIGPGPYEWDEGDN